MMQMLLTQADRKMLTDRVVARLLRERPGGGCTNDDLRLAIHVEADALIAEGGFVFRDGALVRRVPDHECDDGWIAVPDPVLGDHVQTRCPECGP